MLVELVVSKPKPHPRPRTTAKDMAINKLFLYALIRENLSVPLCFMWLNIEIIMLIKIIQLKR